MNAQAVDSSNAPATSPTRQAPLVGFSTNWRSPAAVIQKAAEDATAIEQLGFPHEKLKYYMTLNMTKYSFGGGNAGRTLEGSIQTVGQIRLPLPDNLRDIHSVNWGQINVLRETLTAGAELAGGAVAALIGAKDTTTAQAGASMLGTAGRAAGYASFVAGLARAAGTVVRLNGVMPNQFVTVLLNGPEYKVRDFTWTLSAKTAAEAESLRKIIQVLNNCMAPGLSTSTAVFGLSGLWWNFPNIFFIKFVPNSKFLFEFKPAVLTNFMLDYAGGHVPSFFRSHSDTGGDNAPEAISIHMQFLEIEYWKNGDFGGGAEGGVQPQGDSSWWTNTVSRLGGTQAWQNIVDDYQASQYGLTRDQYRAVQNMPENL